MRLYRIRDWKDRYENNRTRELKHLEWVPIPNDHSTDGYSLVATHPNGPALYGAWVVLLQVASRCGERGTLLRGIGKPHDSSSLARLTRFPEALMQEALEFFCSSELDWLEVVEIEEIPSKSTKPAPSCGNPAPSCENPAQCRIVVTMEGKGIEGNRREENGTVEFKLESRDGPAPNCDPPPDPVAEIINRLNLKTGAKFSTKSQANDCIKARLKEVDGDLAGVLKMIDRQCVVWGSKPDMKDFLTPTTLFRPTKFPTYYAQRDLPVETAANQNNADKNQMAEEIEIRTLNF